MRPQQAWTEWEGSSGVSVATPAPPTVRRDPGERAEDLDGWPPRGWGGNGDGEGGGGGGGGGGDGWGHDPWDDLSRPGTAELALMLSLICIGVLFFVFCGVALLFASDAAQWPPPGAPRPPDGLLASTLLLLLASSVALARALGALRLGERTAAVRGTTLAAGLGVAFLGVQAWLWSDLMRGGVAASNGYVAFFYLLTGLHAVHVLGGLYFLTRTVVHLRREACMTALRLSSTYWHAMGVIWMAVFAILYLVR